MDINTVLIFISSTCMLVGTYFIWFSRYNIPAHLTLGTIFVGYFVPLFFTDVLSKFHEKIVTQYVVILTIGSFFYVAGLIVGFNYLRIEKIIKRPTFLFLPFEKFIVNRYYSLIGITIVSLFAMAVSWIVMGTVPMFAADPFSAKFFKGEYHDAYMRVAIPYRLSQTFLIALYPIIVSLWFLTRKKLLLVLAIFIMLFFSMALTRGLVFSGVFALIALFCSKKKIYLFLFIFIYILVFSAGSSLYFLISVIFGSDIFTINAADANIWSIIAAGAPDISDQLILLNAFEDHGKFTLGRTFLGGLVPGQYYWNPSAWSLYLANNTDDISEVASGGFRIPVAMWGYFAFGWAGVVIISTIAGLILGASTRYIKNMINHRNIFTSILALSFYSIVLGFFSNFYTMSMYSLPACVLVIGFLYRFKLFAVSKIKT